MSVGTFLQPDFEAQSGTVYKTAIDGAFKVLSRIGAMFAPHEQATPDMTVRLDAGALLANVTLSEISAQNTGTITAPTGSDHRIDRVVIDALTGAVSVITGTPGSLPRTAPAITTGKLPICQVALAHGMTVITNDLVTDERVLGGGGGEAFPVGSVYSNIGSAPAGELGYGTWVLAAQKISDVLDGGTASASSCADGTYYIADKAFDNDAATFWVSDATGQPFWLKYDSGSVVAKIINKYTIVSRPSSGQYPVDFKLQGSNNGSAWTDLDTQTGQSFTYGEKKTFNLSPLNATAYRYHRLYITSSSDGSYCSIAEVEMMETPVYQWLRTA